jgi:hypothetical protein
MSPPTAGRPAGDAASNGSGKITHDAVLAAALEIILQMLPGGARSS